MQDFTIEQISDSITELDIHDAYIIPSVISKIKCVSYTNSNKALYGKVYTVVMADIDDPRPAITKNTRDYLDRVPENSIVFILCDSENKIYSTWGELLSIYAHKHNITCTITTGCIRDVNQIKNHQYHVFAPDGLITPVRGNGKYKLVAEQTQIHIYNTVINPGDNIFVSDSGIAIVPDYHLQTISDNVNKIIEKEQLIINYMNNGLSLAQIDDIMNRQLKH